MIWKNKALCLLLFIQAVCGAFPYIIRREQDREKSCTNGSQKAWKSFTLKRIDLLRVYSLFIFALMAIAYFAGMQHLSRENYSWLQSETKTLVTMVNDAVDITTTFLVYIHLLRNHSVLAKLVVTLKDIIEVPRFEKKWYPRMAFFSIFQVTLNFMTNEERWSTHVCGECYWVTHFRNKLGALTRRYVSPILFAQTVMLFHALVLVMEKAYIEVFDEIHPCHFTSEEERISPSTPTGNSEVNTRVAKAGEGTIIYNISKDYKILSAYKSPEFSKDLNLKDDSGRPSHHLLTRIQEAKECLLRIYDFHQLLNSFFLPALTLILLKCVVGSIVSIFSLSDGFMQRCEVLAAFAAMAGHAHAFIYFICVTPEIMNRRVSREPERGNSVRNTRRIGSLWHLSFYPCSLREQLLISKT